MKKNNENELEIDLKFLYKPGRFMITNNGYVFDRFIFRWFSVFVILMMVVVLIKVGGFHTYAFASCPVDAVGGKCDNPAYGMCDEPACLKETLFPGESIGEKKPPIVSTAMFFLFVGFVIALLLNHVGQGTKQFMEAKKNGRN